MHHLRNYLSLISGTIPITHHLKKSSSYLPHISGTTSITYHLKSSLPLISETMSIKLNHKKHLKSPISIPLIIPLI
jgi:hypothetical protein